VPVLTATQRRFVDQLHSHIPIAEAGGVPGAVMIAQATLESGWGESGLARLGNALFGVKARPGWTGRVYSGTTAEFVPGRGYVKIPGPNRIFTTRADALKEGCDPRTLFRAYASVTDNVGDYVRFFRQNPRYRQALHIYAQTHDPRAFAREIARAGYATSPSYARRLIALMQWLTPDVLPPVWTVRVNGSTVPHDAVCVVGGRLFVRVRTLAQLFHMRLDYNEQARTVRIYELTGGPR